MPAEVDRILLATGRTAIDILQLAPFDLERIKAGEPFRRVQELRDAGRARFISVWVENPRDACWVVENTPVHALTIHAPYQTEGWRELFDLAGQADTGIIATPLAAHGKLDEASRILADTTITAFTWPVTTG